MGRHRSKKKKIKRVAKKAANTTVKAVEIAANTTAKAVEVAAPIIAEEVLKKVAPEIAKRLQRKLDLYSD